MSRNGSGVYSLPAGNPVVTGTTISSTTMNNTLNDIANALTGSLSADGQTPLTNNLNANSNTVINLTNPTSAQDSATKNYVDNATGVSVKSFGAVGDGTTDDTVAIQNAINFASTNKQILLFLGGGTYIVDNLILKSNLRIVGDKNTTIKLKASATGTIFFTSASISNFTIDKILFDGNIQNQTSNSVSKAVIYTGSTPGAVTFTNFTYTNNVFNNIASCLQYVTNLNNSNISNNLVNDHSFNAFNFKGDNNIVSQNIILSNVATTSAAAWGVSLAGNNNTISYNNIVLSTSSNITSDNIGIGSGGGNNNQYIYNTIDCQNGVKNYGISTSPGDIGSIINGTKIIGNSFLNNAYYTDLELGNENTLTISGNSHYNSKQSALLFGCTNVNISDVNFTARSDNTSIAVFSGATSLGTIPETINISNVISTGTIQSFVNFINVNKLNINNFTIKNTSNYVIQLGYSGTCTDISISNGNLINCYQPFLFTNITNLNVSNIVVDGATDYSFYQSNCVQNNFSNITNSYPQSRNSDREFNGLWNGFLRVGYTYNNTVSGGATVGVKQLKQSLPAGAVITQVAYQVVQAPTSATNAATIAVGTVSNPNAILSAAAVTNAKYNTIGYYNAIQTGVPSTFTAFSTTTPLILTIANETLTAGRLEFFIYYTINP
jgi:hypothetical protein